MKNSHLSQERLGQCAIYAARFAIPMAPLFSHNFYMLVRKSDGEILESLHGLAAEFTSEGEVGQQKVTGTFHDVLQIYCRQGAWLPVTESVPVYEDSDQQQDAVLRWEHAKSQMDDLNQKKVPYSPFGVGFGFGMFAPILNSNAAYHTLGVMMGVNVHAFGLKVFQPGIKYLMLPREELRCFSNEQVVSSQLRQSFN